MVNFEDERNKDLITILEALIRNWEREIVEFKEAKS